MDKVERKLMITDMKSIQHCIFPLKAASAEKADV